jgi:hypothetical protein
VDIACRFHGRRLGRKGGRSRSGGWYGGLEFLELDLGGLYALLWFGWRDGSWRRHWRVDLLDHGGCAMSFGGAYADVVGGHSGWTRGLHESRRPEGRGGLWRRLRRARRAFLDAARAFYWCRRVDEHRARRRQLDAALTCQSLDELSRHDLLDRARRAFHLDPVIALQQRHHFLARGVEQLRDLINPDSGQMVPRFPR